MLKELYKEMLFQYKDKKQAIEEFLYFRLSGYYNTMTDEAKQIMREYIEARI
jgi:hypothetical protein